MDEALRKIEAALREKRPSSRIDSLLPLQAAGIQGQAGGLGIEHYGKVSMVVEGGGVAAEPDRSEPAAKEAGPVQDAASRIAAGSKELSLDELSSGAPPPGEALKTQQLGGSRFHELSLDDLSSPAEGGSQG
jgi:ribulose 1,5-bisphosphate carboxylase large subunit-like protein